MPNKIEASFLSLKSFCEAEGFKGYDPYDGLNSRLFQRLPFLPKNRFARLVWIQFFKRNPVNLRPLVGIEKDYNPKAMGIFLSGYCQLYRIEKKEEYLRQMNFFIQQIYAAKSEGFSGACWGYNFDWESRAFFQPKFTPTVVASSFIANALLDAYDILGDEELLRTARSTCDFFLKDLNRSADDAGNYAFSYSKFDNSVVYNASLLGSRLLARVYSYTNEEELLGPAKKSVAYCCAKQKADGSWSYGNYDFHQWIDNFHTGYNLECLVDYANFSGDDSFSTNIEQGVNYYINTFFTPEGKSKYYSNATYPIDIHAPTQLIITLVKLHKFTQHKALIDRVLDWTIDHMQDKKGYFYYQINKYFYSRIPYMRWSQSWMFYALATYMAEENRLLNQQKP
jgi:hypothetical protein